MEPAAYALAIVLGALGYILDLWALLAALVIVCGTVAWWVYRWVLRKGWRYYCSSCDRAYRTDYLKGRSSAPQITEIAS